MRERPVRTIQRHSKLPGRALIGYLAEDYDGIGQYVLVRLAQSSSSSAYKARVAAGDFGGGRTFPAGTKVPMFSVRGRLEVLLGNHPGSCIDPFNREIPPASSGSGSLELPVEILAEVTLGVGSSADFAEIDLAVDDAPSPLSSPTTIFGFAYANALGSNTWEIKVGVFSFSLGIFGPQINTGIQLTGDPVTFNLMMRFRVETGVVRLKVWEVGDSEPGAWTTELSNALIDLIPDSCGAHFFPSGSFPLRLESWNVDGFGTDEFDRTVASGFGTGPLGAWEMDDGFGSPPSGYDVNGSSAGTDSSSDEAISWVRPAGEATGVGVGGWQKGPLGTWIIDYGSGGHVADGLGVLNSVSAMSLPVDKWGAGVFPAQTPIELLIQFRAENTAPSVQNWSWDIAVGNEAAYGDEWSGASLSKGTSFNTANADDSRFDFGPDDFNNDSAGIPFSPTSRELMCRFYVDGFGVYARFWELGQVEPKTEAEIGPNTVPPYGGKGEAWHAWDVSQTLTDVAYKYITIDGTSNHEFYHNFVQIISPCKGGRNR